MFNKCRFTPEELIFVPTQGCNLRCAHCFVPKSPETCNVQHAVRFLEGAATDGITYVGFSGGEPFLNVPFLCAVIKSAVAHGLLFDRLMTNGVWWQTESELRSALQAVFDAGFDGTFGISFDSFHAQEPARIKTFVLAAEELWQSRKQCVLVCVKKGEETADGKTRAMLRELAALLGADAVYEGDASFPRALRYRDKLKTFCDDGTPTDEITVIGVDYIPYDATDARFWQSDEWFAEDFCKGPGNVFYVHANGNVAACCGYANECPELILGNINTMSYDEIKKAAATSCKHGFLQKVYGTGLLKTARTMEKKGIVFPGKGRTRDNCLFCRYLLLHKDGMR